MFFEQEVQFLGFLVNNYGVRRPPPDRINALAEYQLPERVYNLRRLLGMINFSVDFYRKLPDIKPFYVNSLRAIEKTIKPYLIGPTKQGRHLKI